MAAPGTDERRLEGESPRIYVERNAREKAEAALAALGGFVPDAVVLAADTVVLSPGGEVLEKPVTPDDAGRMLRALSGKIHRVLSAFVLLGGRCGTVLDAGTVETEVVFRALEESEIARYVRSGEPMDKAGAYAIQGGAASFAASLSGSYTNVVGLPLAEVTTVLRRRLAP